MSGLRIITLGCRLNTFESEVIRAGALAAGVADTVIVNTCAVTAEAERQARQAIRRARRRHPGARIIVTGCAAQLAPRRFAAMAEVDRVVGNAGKLDTAVLTAPEDGIEVSDIMAADGDAGRPVAGFEGRTRAFVRVQQGCDHRCTFCIVPYARGPNRSLAPGEIVEQARKLTANGYIEVVLTGTDICSYGADLAGQATLGELAERLLRETPGLERLRLTTLDPGVFDDTLLRLLAEEPKFMPHLHLSVQSANDTVLKRMKRRHSRADLEALCRRARNARPDVVFGADLIAGFPTESEAMFADTLSAIDDLGLTYLHVFPYSPRPGTPAARMAQLPGEVRRERAARLRAAGEAALARYLQSRVGTEAQVLAEDARRGHSRHFAPVRLDFDAEPGAIVGARIQGAAGDHLIGHRAR